MTLPKLNESLETRYEAFESYQANKETRGMALDLCRADICFWVNEFVWTFDPREKEVKTLPFMLFEKQGEFLRWLQERENSDEDGIAEKCRDVGFTWLCCAYAVHGWLFRPGFRAGFGSRKLELVDTIGDPKCIFEKMRFILDNLPTWMLPRDWSADYCKIVNRDTGAAISGEGGDNIGRGDRASIYFIDEAAHLERSERVDAALSHTSRCKIWVSTPNGMGNMFYRKRFSGLFPVFTFTWRDDPRKPQAWYDAEKLKSDPVTFAQEVDLDYSASVEGICIPAAWVRAAVDLHKRIAMPQTGPLLAALDIAAEGIDKNVMGFRRGPVVHDDILEWGGINTTATAQKSTEECERRGVESMTFDNGGGYGEPVAQAGRVGNLKVKVIPLNGGDTPSGIVWKDGRASHEKFINSRAEWWFLLRERFRKAWEYQEGTAKHPPDEMISIPNNPTLVAQLSTPLVEVAENGKMRLESKAKMRTRGVKSPDHADMLAYLFARRGRTVVSSMSI